MAARAVLKDYVNGRLLFCHVRPDYDRSTHGDIQQSGFSLKQEEQDIVEESKHEDAQDEHEDQADDEEDSDESEEAKEEVHELGSQHGTSVFTGASSKYKAESALEEDLDKEFFTANQQAELLKLNKGEKRALKFAIKRGVKIDDIPNLKLWLEEQVKLSRARKNVKNISEAGLKAKKNDKYARGNNNSNKFYAFTQIDEEGTGPNFSD